MKHPIFLFICLLVFSSKLFAQETALSQNSTDCDVHGSANPNRPEYRLNVYKNRNSLPQAHDFIESISLSQLLESGDESQFSFDKAIILSGYVYNVKMGGVETCNCKAQDEEHRDTHIEITPDNQHTEVQYRLIVEVTHRIRTMMSEKGIDWSTGSLKEKLIGHKVEIEGWLFYDEEHKGQSFATIPAGARNWRASCWEIHPITNIKVLD